MSSCNNNVYLILNKRSNIVNHPGELCCPGGKVSPLIDLLISKILKLPCTPLSSWSSLKQLSHSNNEKISLLFSTALRENFEEMKLNPFGIKMIGILPAQHVSVTDINIQPFVCWITKQKKFFANKEVNKIVKIPLSSLFMENNYTTYKIEKSTITLDTSRIKAKKNPCFIHYENGAKEILWGATYRITTTFLKIVFDYSKFTTDNIPELKNK